ncbi:MAG TPA: hypothetical protein VIS51_03950 [Solirubrobacterales bacterium]
MGIVDACGFCDACGQAALMRWLTDDDGNRYQACVWCRGPLRELVEVPAQRGKQRRIPFDHLVVLHGLHITERISVSEIVERVHTLLGHELPYWQELGFASADSCRQTLPRDWRRHGWPSLGTDAARRPRNSQPPRPPSQHRRPGRPAPLDDHDLRNLFELYQNGMRLNTIANRVWFRLGYGSPHSCARSLAKIWQRRGWQKGRRDEARGRAGEADGGDAPTDRLGELAALVENAA